MGLCDAASTDIAEAVDAMLAEVAAQLPCIEDHDVGDAYGGEQLTVDSRAAGGMARRTPAKTAHGCEA